MQSILSDFVWYYNCVMITLLADCDNSRTIPLVRAEIFKPYSVIKYSISQNRVHAKAHTNRVQYQRYFQIFSNLPAYTAAEHLMTSTISMNWEHY